MAKNEVPPPKRKRREPVTEAQKSMGIPIQCMGCHKIKYPYFTKNPGRKVHGSHYLCPDCDRKMEEQAAKDLGMPLKDFRAHRRAQAKVLRERQEEQRRQEEEQRRQQQRDDEGDDA